MTEADILKDLDLFAEQFDVEKDDIEEVLSLSQRRKRAMTMKRLAPRLSRLRKVKAKRMADPKRLIQRARKKAIQAMRKRVAGNKGQSYNALSPAEKINIDKLVQKRSSAIEKIAKKILPKVKKAELERVKQARTSKNEEYIAENTEVRQDPDIKDRKGTQPAVYHKGLSKSTKAKRDAHFKKKAKMDDDNPNAYTPAPGDAEAKTKPSKHTKKYKQMFGEEVTRKQIQDLEKFADRLLDKFGIDVEFTRHFADRMNDSRNNPEIKISELQRFFKKIAKNKGENIKKNADAEVVLKDMQADLNLPVVIQYDKKNNEVDVINKTIMRKKDFKTSNKTITYESNGQTHDVDDAALKHLDVSLMAGKIKQDINAQFEKKEKAYFSDKKINESFEALDELSSVAPRANYQIEKAQAGLKKKADKSGISLSILKKVYDRGVAAWRTGHRPGTTPQQWGYARVNSFITGGKTRTTADKDLWAKHKGKSESVELDESFGAFMTAQDHEIQMQGGFAFHPCVSEEGGAGERGTDKLTKKYKEDTPGESVDEMSGLKTLELTKAKTIKRKAYDNAKKLAKKEIEKDTKKRHDAAYHIGNAVRKYNLNVDTKVLHHLMKEEADECTCEELVTEQAEYQGRKVTLNDPIRTSEDPKKKFKVYVRNEKGNVVVVRFGDPNMEIKRDDPARRKSFRARHNCSDPGPKWKARYWSCWQWRAGAKVDN